MEIIRKLDHHLWREFVDSHPQGQIFHTPEMFQVFAQAKGHTPTFWAAVNGDQTPQALFMPVQITLMGGPLRRFTTRSVAYGSVLCAPNTEGEATLRLLLRSYADEIGRRILFTELRNPYDLSRWQPVLDECGFAYEEHLNFFVDLTRSPDQIWADIRSNARRNVRRARKRQVIVEEINDPARMPAVYALLKQVYERLQVPLADFSFFQAAFEVLHPQQMMKVLIAKADGVELGVLMLLIYKDTILYWYTGTLREYSDYRAGDMLAWHALAWGSEHGFHVMDFGGAGKPGEDYGVRDFKAKFGGDLVNYGRNVYVHAPAVLGLSKRLYQVARHVLYGREEQGEE
jgi:serine/alanine adding enzyme